MTSLVLPVLAASLLGSVHCASMCGGLVAFYSGGARRGKTAGRAHLSYHAARLLTYVTLGAIAGAIGAGLDAAGARAGLGNLAAVGAGGAMILWGSVTLLETAGVRLPRAPPVRGRLSAKIGRLLRRLGSAPPEVRAGLLGLSSGLLPCGWLYAFVVAAAGTGSAWRGATVLAAFWAGTVPMLLGVGVGVGALTARLRRHVPVLSAILLLAVGLATVLGRQNMVIDAVAPSPHGDPTTVEPSVPASAPCHEH